MSTGLIRDALEVHLNALSGLPDIAWENVDYEPVQGQPFIKVNLQPQVERPAVLGTNPQKEYRGLFILSVHTPINEGPKEADQHCDALTAHFDTDVDLEDSGIVVRIRYAERKAPIIYKAWYVSNVVVAYYCFI